ncbi:MAG: mevalonate kinase [Candidatus Aenigmatarchaeota archaeon]
MPVKVSAPGKVHLVGEHAVVYGEPAIMAAVGLRTYVDAERERGSVIVEDFQRKFKAKWDLKGVLDFSEEARKIWESGAGKKPADFSGLFSFVKGDDFKKAVIGTTLSKLGIMEGVKVRITSEIPTGSGLGSSSALSVAIVKAVSEAYGKKLPLEKINEIAFGCEQLAHGMPSGGDNSTCCFGGLIWFQKDIKTGKFIIKSLRKEVPYEMKEFVLVYTGKPEKTTGELVQQVRMHEPEFRDPRIKRIGEITREMLGALKERDSEGIKSLINEDWTLLRDFGLSTPTADKLIEKIKSMGGAAKLCGACGGGMMLAYHEDLDRLKKAIKSEGFDPMEVKLGVEGVRVE